MSFSWLMFVLIWLAVGLNLASFDPTGEIWSRVKPVYGLAQRALFGSFFLWCAGAEPNSAVSPARDPALRSRRERL